MQDGRGGACSTIRQVILSDSRFQASRLRTQGWKIEPGSRLLCALLSAVLIFLLFGNVLLRRASLAPLDYTEILTNPEQARPAVSWLPERAGRSVQDGQGDIGAAAYQFEPSIRFLAYCMRHGESPFWDPYTATGALGPETMVDIKFSPFSVLVALLGGGAPAFSFTLLALYLVSSYCLMRCCCVELGLSTMAAFGACCVFFLNGFATTNFFNQIAQPYFLAPLLLRSLFLFTRKATARNAALALLVHIGFIATTFFPTAVLSGLVVYSLSMGVRFSDNRKDWRRLLVIHGALPAVAALCLSFLYLPILAAQFTYLDTVGQYQSRLTPGYSLVNLLSLFTPKHFWESYRAMHRPAGASAAEGYEMFVDYLGIAGTLLAANAVFCRARLRLPVALLGFLFLCAVGQMFGLFPFTLIDHLPFFSFVRNEYWACLASLALVFLAAIGLDAVSSKRGFSYLTMLVLSVIACSFFYLLGHVGMPTEPIIRSYLTVLVVITAATAGLLLLARIPRFTGYTKAGLTVLLLAEGMFYMNSLRPYRSRRDERTAPVFSWLKAELQKHPGARVLNAGITGVYPDWGSALQMQELGNLDASELPWYRDFYDRYVGVGLFLSLGFPTEKFLFTDPALAIAGVRYIVVDRSIQPAMDRMAALKYPIANQDLIRVVYENPDPQPRCFVLAGVEKAKDLPSDSGYSDRNIGSTTDQRFLADAARAGIPSAVAGQHTNTADWKSPGSVELREYHHTRVRLHSEMRTPGAVVLADSWSPNWKAYVDGRATPSARVDVTFRGVVVPAGAHEIVFRYENTALLAGEILSGISLAGVMVTLYFWRRRETGDNQSGF